MLNLKLCLFFTLSLIILTFALQPFLVKSISARGDYLCSKTPDPYRCRTCLNSDPKSRTADFRELAMISIRCGENDAWDLYGILYDIQTKTNDTKLKDLVGDCYSKFDMAGYCIDKAGCQLQEKGIDAAKKAITAHALEAVTYCTDLFKKTPGVTVPETVIDRMNGVGTNCGIIMAILNSGLIR